MANKSVLQYYGDVDLKLIINGKKIALKRHNHGTDELIKCFCKLITGNYESALTDIPMYLDLRKSDGNGGWDTVLTNESQLSEKVYLKDETNKWIARFTGVITYDMIVGTSGLPIGDYRLFLTNRSSSNAVVDLAYLDVDYGDLQYIQPGTEAIVEWDMHITNKSA